jgi:amino acid adenylation domain-containing protein
MELPLDGRRDTVADSVTAFSELSLDADTVTALSAVAQRHQARLSDVVLVLWAALLARLSAQDDVVVGMHAGKAGRADGLVLWPVRLGLSDRSTLADGLLALRTQMQAGAAHADIPLERFAAIAHPREETDAKRLFQVGYCFRAMDEAVVDTSVLGHCELALALDETKDGLHGGLIYQTGLFADETIGRFQSWLCNLVRALVADDAAALVRLPLMESEEAAQVLLRWNRTDADYPRDACVHELFEAQVERTPDATAVVDDDRSLSYAALNAQANRLAHHLRAVGVVPDSRVAIYLERNLEMVVAVLAVLKAGAAYVPLDPTYPVERLGYTLQDSEPVALLTQTGMANDWRTLVGDGAAGMQVIDLKANPAPWQDSDAGNEPGNQDRTRIGLDPGHLAYVLYTSGSTGKPKGVAMPHGPLVNLVCWQNRQPGSDGPRRTLQFAALGFDVAFQEMFSTLSAGGELHLIDADTRLSADRLFAFIVEHRIERVFLPYFALQILAEGLDNHCADLPAGQRVECALREVITAGEQLRIEPKIARFFERIGGCRLHNHYGPTETHVVTALTLPDDPACWPRLPSIGTPIANARVYLLDGAGQPVPDGVVGELYLAGPVVARGYLKRDELTAERFLDDRLLDDTFSTTGFSTTDFSTAAPARMYRTGDIGRRLPDGDIELLGRKDFQVKVRGFRIELGEIEAQIMACPGVREAGVMAREDTPGMKRLVAYFTSADAVKPVDIDTLRQHLVARLPDYMVPVAYVPMEALPLSPNGKLDRARLPAPGRGRPDWAGAYEPPRGETEAALCRILAEVLDLESIGRNDNFFDLGGSSLLAVRALQLIRREGLGEASVTALFSDPTPAALVRELELPGKAAVDPLRLSRRRHDHEDPIAIIAMDGRFPGAGDVETFWRNLCEGRDSISFFSPDELDPGVGMAERNDPAYVAARGVIDGVEQFDAAFFGISPREAELMDPQQRIFLELCWACMERAGHVPGAAADGPVGVFAGMYNASYFQRHVSQHPELIDRLGAFQVMLGNEKDYIATRVAHKLNLTGPAISIHTACSTSLVAICQAVDSLRAGRCDMALAGGVSVTCPPRSGYLYQEGAMYSPDGRTRTFDAEAKGTVFCDGAAVVLLKRLSDAIADGDPVHAVIRGVAVNNDGSDKASFTAPSSEAQAAVIAMAHEDAQVDPRSIGYVETHGTATPLGDPIEVEGLTRAFRRGTDDTGFCRIGSLKSNVGHLLIAAGAASVIKTALSLEHRHIPASLYFEAPNPVIDFAGSPFVVNAAACDWPDQREPRRAGVSSFGVGGTNAHAVLEEAPARPVSEPADGTQLLVLSARTPAALEQAVGRLTTHLQQHADFNLADVAWTLATGRKAFAHRVAVAATDVDDAVAQLHRSETVSAATRSRPARASDVVFLFPGQGATYPGMGRELHAAEPVFREAFDACAEALGTEFTFDLRERVFSDDPGALLPTAIMQPATFAIEYALARLWMSHGIEPAAMIGHSVGEFVAATLAGVFEPGDAIRLVARRGALMQAEPTGAMLSVRMPLDDLQARLPEGISLAAENAPGACVVAGPSDAMAAFQSSLEADGIACRALRTSHAFHSAMMEPVVAPFLDAVEQTRRSAPQLPLVSTATGDWLDEATAVSPEYWARHLRQPVRFSCALLNVLDRADRVLLEVGPRTTLCGLARLHPPLQKQHIATVATLSDTPAAETAGFLQALGQLWSRGVAVDPANLDRRQSRRRVCLPTYPFEHQRYWIEAMPAATNVIQHPAVAAAQENLMPHLVTDTPEPVSASVPTPVAVADRKPRLVAQLREVIEDVAGFDMEDADPQANFIELGLDSLVLTQVALQVQKTFSTKVTFRQLMSEAPSLESLAAMLDAQLPPEPAPAAAPAAVTIATASAAMAPQPAAAMPMPIMAAPTVGTGVDNGLLQQVIAQQMQLMSQQLALLGGAGAGMPVAKPPVAPQSPVVSAPRPDVAPPLMQASAAAADGAAADGDDDEAAVAHTRYDIKKAFGAIARIDSSGKLALNERQRARLDAFIERYVARTRKSRDYTRMHRPHMADPRVVNGFRPLTKEIVYQIVIERTRGSRMWDLDGNEYVDALNGFGMSLFGWQPDFVMDAVRRQLELGIEIGPQHPLAGDVARLVCELTGHDRAALCNTGSEAVLGALRIARTVTGRETLVVFNGSYHGIIDEVIVRGTRKLRAVPAAPGILRNTAEHVLVLDYGTPEAMRIIRERAHEIAAVLVEPVQSRRPDFRPVEFLKELRQVTEDAGAALIFDEVITGFRAHPGGTQAMFGIKADIATYGKVIGGGHPIGVIAGKREFMDALDGGQWEYGDDSVPTVGVTYFAGTFVRHPLALAAAKAVLEEMKRQGGQLQERLNAQVSAMADEINAFCASRGAPIEVRTFASVWKTFFLEDHPLQDLLFAMMRSRGIHILDNFPCFLTTAHSEADFRRIIDAFKESVVELQESEFLPRHSATPATVMNAAHPPVPGARIGRDPDGRPAWFIDDPGQPGAYVKVG